MAPLHVEESGSTSAPSIVFLHGIGASGWMWWRQTSALPDFDCLNVDLPGHGQSNHLEWQSLADTADSVGQVIRTRATSGQAHVVGLSLGGYVALTLLERHTELVESAVISGVTARRMPNCSLARPQAWFMSLVMRRRWVADLQAKALHLTAEEQAAFTANLRAMSMQSYRRILDEVSSYEAPMSLREVDVPMLVVAGGAESKIILESVEHLSKLMPRAEGRVAPGRKHGWNLEAPELFSAMVRAWFTGQPLPAGLEGVQAPATARPAR